MSINDKTRFWNIDTCDRISSAVPRHNSHLQTKIQILNISSISISSYASNHIYLRTTVMNIVVKLASIFFKPSTYNLAYY